MARRGPTPASRPPPTPAAASSATGPDVDPAIGERSTTLVRFRSPLRGPWLTAVFGYVLLFGLPVVIVTGLLSYAAYNPRLPSNDTTPFVGWLRFYLFDWPSRPSWIYRLNQGLHVTLGLMLVPVVLAKLWSVIPKLFVVPPARTLAAAVERLSLVLLVGGILFELVTGVLNIQNDYVFGFSFYTAHLIGAWVFLAAFVAHVGIKLPVLRRSLRARRLRDELRTDTAHTQSEPLDPDGLVAASPAPATLSRRGVLGLAGGASLLVGILSVGQTIGGPLRRIALLAPRGRNDGLPGNPGPNNFPINKTAAAVGIRPSDVGGAWRLELRGRRPAALSRAELAALPQHTVSLPIACVEGWSTVQTWTGVRLVDLAGMAGYPGGAQVLVESIQNGGFGVASLSRQQVADPDSVLALRVNGADLSLDHGFPARVIVPGAPGVHCTKWVRRLSFGPGR